ncbi:hypothetical protein SEVIR_5G211850v4 [Setaria viridis]
MASVVRRRRLPDRLAWIYRRTWSKQRGAKLRTTSSESDGSPNPVVKPVLRDGDSASKLALKVGGGDDDYGTRSPKLGSGGDSCGPNTGTCGCDGSPKHIMEAGGDDGDDVSYSPMLGCCCCNEIGKHLVAEEGGCEGTCRLNFGSCDCDGSPKHARRSRLRVDPDGQLYVVDSEAEDSALEESCRPVLRRGQGAFGRRSAAMGEMALEAGTTKATAVTGGEMTEEMVQYIEQCLTGIEEANMKVFIPWIKVFLFSALLRKIQIKGMTMNWCIIKEARFPCSLSS